MDPFSVSMLMAGLAVILAILYQFLGKDQQQVRTLAPGPQGLERLGGLFYLLRTGRIPEIAAQWAEKYGDIVRVDGLFRMGRQFVMLNNPAIVREFYTDKATRGITNSRQVSILTEKIPHNIVFSSPENSCWAQQRKLFHKALKFYGEGYQSMERTIQKELRSVVHTLKEQEGQDVQVRPFFFNSILNLIHILLTGENLSASQVSVRQSMAAYTSSLVAVLNFSFLLKARFFPFLFYLPGSVKATWDRFNSSFKAVIDHFYHRVKATHTAGKVRGIVDAWLEMEEKGEEAGLLTDKHVHGLISDVFSGGTLTTSETLTSMFLFLLNHGEVVKRIQAEVDRAVQADQWPSLEHRDLCPYTQATLLETQRVLSLLPMSVSHLVIEDTELRGYFIPKGTSVVANQWWFHRSEALWRDALQFLPERFLDEQGQLLPATHPLRQQVLPFGIGPRSCPGESFARARMFLYVTTILHHFDPLPPLKGDLPPLTPGLDSWEKSSFMVVQDYSCRFAKRERN